MDRSRIITVSASLRLPFVNDIMSPAMQAWREQMKFALDPQGVFAAQLPLESHEQPSPDGGIDERTPSRARTFS